MAYNKYTVQKKQVSNDNGLTWQDVSPLETRQGDYVATYSSLTDCEGETPPPTPTPYEEQYLTFVAETDNVSFEILFADTNVFQYSINGSIWNSISNGQSTPSINNGDRIKFKGSNLTVSSSYGIGTIRPSSYARVEGNIMSLIYGNNFSGQTTISNDNQFTMLFSQCSGITNAENLVLPATTLVEGCYYMMFYGCKSLTKAPSILPATTLAQECYYKMFNNCSGLTTAPELPATTLAQYCYQDMFAGCTSLTTAPVLSATTLAQSCYYQMFSGCTSLTVAPELPATTLAERCYQSMFYGCTNLTTAPVLSATTLVNRCYYWMFYNCANLNSITCLATNISSASCTNKWVKGVASTGTFYKNPSMSSWSIDVNGIPSGWTVQNNS